MSGRPASGWRTLARLERIRVPRPAARMTASNAACALSDVDFTGDGRGRRLRSQSARAFAEPAPASPHHVAADLGDTEPGLAGRLGAVAAGGPRPSVARDGRAG